MIFGSGYFNRSWVAGGSSWGRKGECLKGRLFSRTKGGRCDKGDRNRLTQDDLERIQSAAVREVEQEKKHHDEVEAAKNVALRFLSFQLRSSKVLKSKLIDKEISPDIADEVVLKLQEAGIQSDRDFASGFARGKWRQSRWSPEKIRTELKYKHGLSDDDINFGLKAPFQEDDPCDNQVDDVNNSDPPDSVTFGEGALADLVKTCRRRIEIDPKLSDEAHRRRLIGWLQRRGYNWDTIKEVLQQLNLGF